MPQSDTVSWKSLEQWAPALFVLAGVLSLVAGANYGVTALLESVSFNSWIGLTVLLARVASLLGVAGLTVGLAARSPRLGTVSRVVVALTLLFTIGLLASGTLANLGVQNPIAPVLGLGTVALSILTYSLFGAGILYSGSHSTVVGGLLLGASLALVFGMFGRVALPLGVVGTVAEAGLFVVHVGIAYRLYSASSPTERADATAETAAE